MSDAMLAVVFVAGSMVSLGSSWVLVSRLERVGARLGLSEALLGMLAALAADAPEITAAVTALAGHNSRIGAGVVIGSNVFNLAALLGLAAVLAGEIALHRRVIVLEGVVAVWVAAVCVAVVVGLLSPAVGLVVVMCLLVPYLVVLGVRHDRLRRLGLPAAWVSWLTSAIVEEELELEAAIHPRRGRARDAIVAAIAVLVVVGASVAMEQAAVRLGADHGIPEIVVGGLILAAVTSLPNAVAAVYLARRGRGAATLSTAMNSNALNVAAGLLLPATIVGLGDVVRTGDVVGRVVCGVDRFRVGVRVRCAWTAAPARRADHLRLCGVCRRGARKRLLVPCRCCCSSIALSAAVGIVLAAWMMRGSGRRVSGEQEVGNSDIQNQRDDVHAVGGFRLVREPDRDARGQAALTNGRWPRVVRPNGNRSLITGWSVRQLWYLALAISSVVAAIDAILGHHVILIWLLVVGPCCALLTGHWARTATAGPGRSRSR